MVSELLLGQYHFLRDSDDIELRHILMDLLNALREAGLTEREWLVIHATYLCHPRPPLRENRKGRPKGGHTQYTVVAGLLDILAEEPRKRHFAARRTSEYNVVRRSSYWYKKVLQRALSKIDQALNYEDVHDLSAQTVRYLHSRHPSRGQIVY